MFFYYENINMFKLYSSLFYYISYFIRDQKSLYIF